MHTPLVRFGLSTLLVLGLIGALPGQRPAGRPADPRRQAKDKTRDNLPRLEDGETALDKLRRETAQLRTYLFKGEVHANPADKDHVRAIFYAAADSAYPLYWRSLGKPKPSEINEIVEKAGNSLGQLTRALPATAAMTRLFVRELVDRAAEVAQKGKPIAGINACRILGAVVQRRVDRGAEVTEKAWVEEVLPRLAEGNAEHLAGACLALLAEPRLTDGHRYYLYRTLAELLALPAQTPPLLKQETVDKVLREALRQVEKKVAFPKATPRPQREGYKALREQAVRVLAAARRPAAGDKDRPALALARIAAADPSVTPEPRFSERLEAAIGLARLGPVAAKSPDLQLDYAAAAIASAVANLGDVAKDSIEDVGKKAYLRRHPWRVDAARMNEALDELKAADKSPYVQEAVRQCQTAVLIPMEAGRQISANTLADWLGRNPPASKSLFKSDPGSTLETAPATPK